MNSKKLRKIILSGYRKNTKKHYETKFINNPNNRNNKILINASMNNNSINITNLGINKRRLHFSLSNNRCSHFRNNDLENYNNYSESLRDDLIKTKEQYNEKSNELYNLKLKYNKLNQFNIHNLKLLHNIMNKAGISNNKEDINNNLDISQILSKEERETLKGKHLISCFKTKLLEYRNLIDKRDIEISKIRKSARINNIAKLENESACKSLENMNLNIEKSLLNNKILNMENIVDDLNNKYNRLKKSENKNMLNIGDLMNKIQIMSEKLIEKDKLISNFVKKMRKSKEDKKTLENKIQELEQDINKFEEDKKKCEKFLKEKENYEKNEENMKRKLETIKSENEKLKVNLNKSKDLNNEILKKYEEIREEKDKLKLIKDEIKKKLKDKDKEIKLLDDKIKSHNEKLKEEIQKINLTSENFKKNCIKNTDNNDENYKENQNDNYKESKMENQNENENYNIENENLKILIKMYKDTEKKYTEEIELLKEKILKLEEKNNLFNKIM